MILRAPFGVVLALVAGTASCSTTTSPGAPAPNNPVSGNSLSGSYAFPVGFAFIDAQTPRSQCGDVTAIDGGTFGSIAILISDVDIRAADGSFASINPNNAHLLRIEVAGPSYTGGAAHLADGAAPEPLAETSYAIGYEGEDDDDLCMLPTGTSAILDRFDFSGDGSFTQATAISGSVSFTSLASGRVTGTFGVQLAPFLYPATGFTIDVQHAVSFSGSFDATTP